MKQMKSKRNWIALASILALVALATPGFAWTGYGPGYGMMGSGYGGYGMMGPGYYGMMAPVAETSAPTDASQNQVGAAQSQFQTEVGQADTESSRMPGAARTYHGGYNGMMGYQGYGMYGGNMGGMMYGNYAAGMGSRNYAPCGW